MTPSDDTDRAIILRMFRDDKNATPASIAAATSMPISYVRNVIDRLRDSGVLPEAIE